MNYRLEFYKHKYLVFFAGIILICIISQTYKIDQKIAGTGRGYFVDKNIDEANEAGRLGYIKYEVNDYARVFGLKWKSKPGVRRIIRSGPDDFDDIGYVSMLQLIAIMGKEINRGFLEKMHNYSFILSLIILSFVIAKTCNNILSGWLFLVMSLVFKTQILSLLYGWPENRSLVVFFPPLVIAMTYALKWLGKSKNMFMTAGFVLLFGLLIGFSKTIRSSEGLAALFTVLFTVFLLKVGFKRKIMFVIITFIGYFIVTVLIPIIFALHRDIKTGEYPGTIAPYLATTGGHPVWHSILIGMGKYPNSLGMMYDDITCYNIVRKKYPNAMHPVYNIHGEKYYLALQKIYFKYVLNHPVEYAINLMKSYAELFLFVPYVTSAGNLIWFYGYPPVKPGVVPETRDIPPQNVGLINFKFKYLKLSFLELTSYIIACISMFLFTGLYLFGRHGKENRIVFLSMGFYLFLLGSLRAFIPAHGISFVVCFWIFCLVAFVTMCFDKGLIYSASHYISYLKNIIKAY